MKTKQVILSSLLALTTAVPAMADGHKHSMSFFVTSAGGGDGANFGGLKGADAH